MGEMLSGIVVKPLKRFADERGFFTEIMRRDWDIIKAEDEIVQANMSITYPGVVRAWHNRLSCVGNSTMFTKKALGGDTSSIRLIDTPHRYAFSNSAKGEAKGRKGRL